MIVVNPDHFLGNPRVFTEEKSTEAWQMCRRLLEDSLAVFGTTAQVYFVCGVQGAGKSYWVRTQASWFREPAVVIDAAFPRACNRAAWIALVRSAGSRLIGLHVRTSLETALRRNRQRSEDAVVPEHVVRLVHRDFEPPSLAEGFDEVHVVDNELSQAQALTAPL
jgi:AAA domain